MDERIWSAAEIATIVEQGMFRDAAEEETLMAAAPCIDKASGPDLSALTSLAVMTDPTKATDLLRENGLLQIDGLLKPDTVSTLLAHITKCLVDARFAAKETLQGQRFFANVRQPVNSAGDQVRCDLKLELQPPVTAAVMEALAPLKAVHIATLGAAAELFELGALVSDPSALRQCVHADTGYTSEPIACSTFIALQDIDEDMGPTVFIPNTHQEYEAHVALQAREPAPGSYSSMTDRERLLQGSPNHVATLSSGDAIMFDSRVLHCGTANTSIRRRVIFYFSFRAKGGELGQQAAEATPTGTLLEGAAWGTSLLGTQEHASAPQD